MPSVFAVCPHCGKNIKLSEFFDNGNCPLCGVFLDAETLQDLGAIINVAEANNQFETGMVYFDNLDYVEATNYFNRALIHNQNHYLAAYRKGLCEFYDNVSNEDFDVPKQLLSTLKSAIIKLNNSMIDTQYKTQFMLSSLSEINSMLVNYYKMLDDKFDGTNDLTDFRNKSLMIAKYINSFLSIDKEFLLTFDKDVKSTLLQLIDIALTTTVKAVATHIWEEKVIDAPTDEQFNAAQKFYSNLYFYATSLDSKFSIARLKPDFTEVLKFNKDVNIHIQKYYSSIGKKNNKAYLSVVGGIYENLISRCTAAAKLNYYSCFRNLYMNKNEPARINMLTNGMNYCLEVLRPRIYFDGNRRVRVLSRRMDDCKEISVFLNEFLLELLDCSKKHATEALNNFFDDVNAMTELYFSLVVKNYSKVINRIKNKKNEEYVYYRHFLYQIVCNSIPALTDVIEVKIGRSKNRISLLKTAKKAAEEFLLLCNYNIVEVEQMPKYSDLINIYNTIETNILFLEGKLK